MIIKCSSHTCNKQEDVEDDVVGWYCVDCRNRIKKNIDTWLKSDECMKIQENYWKEVDKIIEIDVEHYQDLKDKIKSNESLINECIKNINMCEQQAEKLKEDIKQLNLRVVLMNIENPKDK